MSRSHGPAFAAALAGALALATAPAARGLPPYETGFTEIGRCADDAAGPIAMDGGIAWYGRGPGLAAVDVSDPDRPAVLALLALGGGGGPEPTPATSDLAARGGWLYAMAGDEMVVVDGRRPRQPRVVARVSLACSASWGPPRLELAGDVVYCVNGDLFVFDVREPARPRLASRLRGIHGRDVAAGGGRLFVAGHHGLVVLDATLPMAPFVLEIIGEDQAYAELLRVWVLDGVLLVGGRGFLETRTDLLGGPEAPWWRLEGLPLAAARRGDELLVSGNGLLACHEPWSDVPRWIDGTHVHRAWDIAVAGDLMAVTRGSGGLQTWDVGAGPDPVLLAAVRSTPVPVHLSAQGDLIFAACGFSGLQVFDVSRPRQPRPLGACDDAPSVPRSERFLAEFASPRGDLVLVGGVLGLRLVDVGDPSDPRLVQEIRARPDGSRLRPLAALALEDGWLVSCDTTDREAPGSGLVMVRAGASGPATVTDVRRSGEAAPLLGGDGRLLYGRNPDGTLQVARVTPADSLVQVGAGATGFTRFNALAVAGAFVFVTDGRQVAVMDVSDPARPRARGATGPIPWAVNSGISSLAACGRMVFVGSERSLGLVDASDPDAPVARAGLPIDGYPTLLAAGAGEAYFAAAGEALLGVLRPHRGRAAGPPASGAAASGRVLAMPNPCNPRTTVSFTMASAGAAVVAVYDTRGRRVRLLRDGELQSGPQALAWSGDDDEGRAVAAGVYLVRVETPGDVRVARVTVVK